MLYLILLLLLIQNVSCKIVQEADSSNIHKYIGKDKVLVHFYAPWCQQCQMFRIIYEKLGMTLTEKGFSLVSVDVASNQVLANVFKVSSIPSVFLLRKNTVYKYQGESLNENQLHEWSIKGYSRDQPLNTMESPLGPAGRFKFLLLRVGHFFTSVPQLIRSKLQLQSQIMSIVLSVFVAVIIIVIGLAAVVYFSLKDKEE